MFWLGFAVFWVFCWLLVVGLERRVILKQKISRSEIGIALLLGPLALVIITLDFFERRFRNSDWWDKKI